MDCQMQAVEIEKIAIFLKMRVNEVCLCIENVGNALKWYIITHFQVTYLP